ncbi:MAG: radical SAM protein, partial [Bacteroidota bacterium]
LKWVIIVSTLYGCPVQCRFCDSGGQYSGKISADEMLAQIDHVVAARYTDRRVPSAKFKIQFARMGEPAMNPAVLKVLRRLSYIYDAPGLMPSISTIAPRGCDIFFSELIDIKNELYGKNFQMQFSLHSTDDHQRDWLMPVPKWSFEHIAEYGVEFHRAGERKITLNFAVSGDTIIDTSKLLDHFSPDIFIIKITPVNPTFTSKINNIAASCDLSAAAAYINKLEAAGYDVIPSIGEPEENLIGSNCGQHVMNYLRGDAKLSDSYTYSLIKATDQ